MHLDPEPYPYSVDPADADPEDAAMALAEHEPSGGPCEDRIPLDAATDDPDGPRARGAVEVDSSRYVTYLDGVD